MPPGRMREIRRGVGLTQDQFAELVGVTRQYINAMERGAITPSVTLSRLIDAIGQGYWPPADFAP